MGDKITLHVRLSASSLPTVLASRLPLCHAGIIDGRGRLWHAVRKRIHDYHALRTARGWYGPPADRVREGVCGQPVFGGVFRGGAQAGGGGGSRCVGDGHNIADRGDVSGAAWRRCVLVGD